MSRPEVDLTDGPIDLQLQGLQAPGMGRAVSNRSMQNRHKPRASVHSCKSTSAPLTLASLMLKGARSSKLPGS